MKSFDYAVIGAGPGGYVSAIRAAQLGLNTVLIEKDSTLGGTCLNVGCIPSKALLESSEWYSTAKHKFADHGIKADKIELDLPAMLKRKSEVVKTLTGGVAMLMKKNKVTVMHGTGKLLGNGKIEVNSEKGIEEINANTIVLAMGSVPVELPFMKFDGKQVVNSTDALAFEEVPEHLIVIGAGAIGLEMGSVWGRLGSKITVLEMLPRIAPFADKQIGTLLQKSLKNQGFDFKLESKVTDAKVKGDKVTVTYEDSQGKSHQVTGSKVLVAVGRKPFSTGAGLEEAGIEMEKNGMVKINDRWQTNVEGVYAIGDLIQGPMLAHKAEEEGIAVAELAAEKPGHVNYEAIPNIIYTWPELAAVGLTEEEVKEKEIEYKVGKFFFRANGRALSMGESEGMVKIIADKKTDRLLGAHIVGPRASDMIAELVIGMEFQGSAEDIALSVHAHPTLSEIVKEAALAVDGRAIHS